MGNQQFNYKNAEDWREEAMLRPDGVSEAETASRRKIAELHNRQNHVTDVDTLLDQQLYILGKMELEEYQAYLVFKHGASAGG